MRLRLASVLCASLGLSCTGELVPIGAQGDAAATDGDAGTGEMVFRPRVQQELGAAGCLASGCHGGTSIPMQLVAGPASDDDWRDNYAQVQSRAGTTSSSLLIDKALGAGGHASSFAADDPFVQRLRTWISAGTPYQASAGADAGASTPADAADTGGGDATSGGGLTWQRDIDPVMRARCTSCHGTQGAYSLESYGGALGFGRDGIPNVVPGDATSLLAQYVEQGHEDIPYAEALVVIEWIVDWNAAER